MAGTLEADGAFTKWYVHDPCPNCAPASFRGPSGSTETPLQARAAARSGDRWLPNRSTAVAMSSGSGALTEAALTAPSSGSAGRICGNCRDHGIGTAASKSGNIDPRRSGRQRRDCSPAVRGLRPGRSSLSTPIASDHRASSFTRDHICRHLAGRLSRRELQLPLTTWIITTIVTMAIQRLTRERRACDR